MYYLYSLIPTFILFLIIQYVDNNNDKKNYKFLTIKNFLLFIIVYIIITVIFYFIFVNIEEKIENEIDDTNIDINILKKINENVNIGFVPYKS